MDDDIDYRRIDYDPGIPREEWSYQARRAYILERIEEAGHPDFLNQSELAREFDKGTSTIHRDIKRLREFVTENIDEQRLDHIGVTLYESAIKDEIANENWGQADHLFQQWTRWLDKRGLADYLPDEDDDEDDDGKTVGDISLEVAGVSDMTRPAEDVEDTADEDAETDEREDPAETDPPREATVDAEADRDASQ